MQREKKERGIGRAFELFIGCICDCFANFRLAACNAGDGRRTAAPDARLDAQRDLRNIEVLRQLDSAAHMLERRLHGGAQQTIPILSDTYPELSTNDLLTVGLSFASLGRRRFGSLEL